MSLRTLALAYLFGGLTFLPLLCAALVAAAWYTLPRVQDANVQDSKEEVRQTEDGSLIAQQERKRLDSFGETAASGTFAVARKYDLPAAIAAFSARNNASASSNAGPGTDGGATADASSRTGGDSVYQSMYRSVFTSNKNASSTSLLAPDEQDDSPGARRKTASASLMYIVLRHGHLMLYDSPAQVEVKHVISLAHHSVSLQAGKDGDEDADEKMIPEADLFTKRTAIVLTPVDLPSGSMQTANQKPAKPFYLFCPVNNDKEDFYHALLATRTHPPEPRILDADALIKLQSTLHSSSLTPETRALNALIGRIFLGVHQTDNVANFVRRKIERKLARIQKPSFIPSLTIRSLNLGDAAPLFSNLKLRDLNISGDLTLSADMRYNGGLSITLLAVAKLDLGARFKTRTVDLVLKASLQRIQGTMLLHVKPSPSNRFWFCFETMPELEIRVEPVVSERKITYGFVLRAIEERVRTAFADGLVKPNWDDVPMPLQDTRGSHARGGVWTYEGEEEHAQLRPNASRIMADRNEKTMSTPILSQDDTAASSSLYSNSEVNLAKIRHSATMPVDRRELKRRPVGSLDASKGPGSSPERTVLPPKPLRSPSSSAMSPSVAIDGKTVEPVRSDDTSLQPSPAQTRKLWRPRGTPPQQQQQKDALEGLRDLRNRAEQAAGKPSSSGGEDEETLRRRSGPSDQRASTEDVDAESIRSRQLSEGSDSTIPATPRSFSMRTTDSDSSTAATSVSSVRSQQKRANILAAAGAATNAARNWGWNAYQKNKGAFQRPGPRQESSGQQTPSEPMGRGQPLPPPGMPLPGPNNKGLFGGIGRRKPVPNLPPRRSTWGSADEQALNSTAEDSPTGIETGTRADHGAAAEDEFGTWHENSGTAEAQASASGAEPDSGGASLEEHDPTNATSIPEGTSSEDLVQLDDDDTILAKEMRESEAGSESKPKKLPPPLPARRRERTNDGVSKTNSSSTPGSESEDTGEVNETDKRDDAEDGSGLRVPEYAAREIAAENSTIERAHGAEDDTEHVDESRAVEAEIRPDLDYTTLQQEGSKAAEQIDENSAENLGLRLTNTEDRFRRGEHISEGDFEHDEAKPQSSSSEDGKDFVKVPIPLTEQVGDEESSTLSARIKAQVQKHASGDV